MANELTIKQRSVIDLLLSGQEKTLTTAVRKVYDTKNPAQIATQLKESKNFQVAFSKMLELAGISDYLLALKGIQFLSATLKRWDPVEKKWYEVPDNPTQLSAWKTILQAKGAFQQIVQDAADKPAKKFSDGECTSPEEEKKNLERATGKQTELEVIRSDKQRTVESQ